MNLYNMLCGVTPATFFILPLLQEKHPDQYPRFRDCFTGDPKHPQYEGHIIVYTRVGSLNRGNGYGEEELEAHPNFAAWYNDPEDATYGCYVFSVPNEWKADYKEFVTNGPKNMSKAAQTRIRAVFPKLKEKLDQLWGSEKS